MGKLIQCETCNSMAGYWVEAREGYFCPEHAGVVGGAGEKVVDVDPSHYSAIADKVLTSMNAADMLGVVRDLREARVSLEEINGINFKTMAERAGEAVEVANTTATAFAEAKARVEEIIKNAEIPKRIEFKRGKKVTKVKGYQHRSLGLLGTLVASRLDAYLGGPAGGGKNTACAQIAEAAGLPFYSLQLSKLSVRSDLVGYVRPMDGVKVETAFSKAYENGGVFVADELDNWNSGVLTSINSALANGEYTFPWGVVERHEDFIFVGCGNTIGMGATANYSERSALSGATRDRLVFIDWVVDEKLERKLTDNEEWFKFVTDCRKLNEANGGTLLITPRATMQGTVLLKQKVSRKQVVDSVLLRSAPCPSYIKEAVAGFIAGGES